MLDLKPAAGRETTGPRSRIGLALAGGGPLGIIYEIGVMLALEEALENVHFNDLHAYVGVSAGAANASVLANGISPAEMCRIFVLSKSAAFPLNPEHFLKPALHLYARGLRRLPRLFWNAVREYALSPGDSGLLGALSQLALALPSGVWDNSRIYRFLIDLFSSRGRTNDFRKLKRRLFIVATRLDTAEIVKFGTPGQDHVPIARAVQASTAVPGLFPPVAIDGEYYVDGGLMKTVHASTALDAGAELLFCINPIVSFNAKLVDPTHKHQLHALVEGGFPIVMSQAFRTIIHSRMAVGISHYGATYPDKDVILFEPDSGDANMFFANVFSFGNRVEVCEHAYQTTRADLYARRNDLARILQRHGVTLQTDVLVDKTRHFDSHLPAAPEETRQAKLRNPVTNDLSYALDQLEEWLQSPPAAGGQPVVPLGARMDPLAVPAGMKC